MAHDESEIVGELPDLAVRGQDWSSVIDRQLGGVPTFEWLSVRGESGRKAAKNAKVPGGLSARFVTTCT